MRSKCYLDLLPGDLILYIFDFLPLPDLTRWLCSCKRVYCCGSDILQQKTKERFRIDGPYHSIRLKHESIENCWLPFYQRLDQGFSGWRGFAFDPFTNLFEPYPMELVFQEAKQKRVKGIVAEAIGREVSTIRNLVDLRLVELEGFCRWRTLGDSLTKVGGSIVDKCEESRFWLDPTTGRLLIRHIIFEELQIIRGSGIAIPNRYYGFCDGFVVIGGYDPGEESAKGMFCIVLEESIKIPRTFLKLELHDKFCGLSSSVKAREIHQITMQITKVTKTPDGSRIIMGTLNIDESPGMSTLNFSRRPKPCWKTASFTALSETQEQGDEDQPILSHFEVTSGHSKHFPIGHVSLIQQGCVMIGFFKTPEPSCFYLFPQRYSD
jgi:hypothetical protein